MTPTTKALRGSGWHSSPATRLIATTFWCSPICGVQRPKPSSGGSSVGHRRSGASGRTGMTRRSNRAPPLMFTPSFSASAQPPLQATHASFSSTACRGRPAVRRRAADPEVPRQRLVDRGERITVRDGCVLLHRRPEWLQHFDDVNPLGLQLARAASATARRHPGASRGRLPAPRLAALPRAHGERAHALIAKAGDTWIGS